MHANPAFRAPHRTVDPHGCVPPGWYLGHDPGAVPTWNILADEFEGVVDPLSPVELREHLERKAVDWEPVEPRWTLAAVAGFRMTVHDVRVTTKLSQNESAGDGAAVGVGLRGVGNPALAERMA